MKLADYFEENCINVKMFCIKHGLIYDTVLNVLKEKHTPSVKIAVAVEKATKGEVTIEDMIIDEKKAKRRTRSKASKKPQ